MLCHVVCCTGDISSHEPTAFIFGKKMKSQNPTSLKRVLEKLMTDKPTTNVQAFYGPEDENCL